MYGESLRMLSMLTTFPESRFVSCNCFGRNPPFVTVSEGIICNNNYYVMKINNRLLVFYILIYPALFEEGCTTFQD